MMLGKRPRPMIGKLSELLVSGSNKPRPMDVVGTSPRSPLDAKTLSPRSLKRYDAGHGVGLGIVAALDKTVCGSDLMNRPNPILISPCKNRAIYGDSDMESLEDYTYVTSYGPGKSSSTKVYYDGAATNTTPRHDTKGCFGAVKEIPAPAPAANKRLVEEEEEEEEDVNYYYPTLDFLSYCHLCRKQLHGKDIYMYRGEKGFCSTECRSTQIMMDERKEQCRSEASRSANNNNKVSNSSYNKDQIFSTGILAI